MHKQGKLIVIDGPSCVGKTQLAKELQTLFLPAIWLNFSIDTMVYTLPSEVLAACNLENHWDAVDVNALMQGAFSCVKSLLLSGNHIVFDVVISSAQRGLELETLYSDCDVFYIGVRADWECLEQRALLRPDRTVAEARHGYQTAPKHLPYDVLLDTTHQDPYTLAKKAVAAMRAKRFGTYGLYKGS